VVVWEQICVISYKFGHFTPPEISPVHVREIYRERRGERERKLGEKEGTKKKRKNISL
jgi:hypothetical protein